MHYMIYDFLVFELIILATLGLFLNTAGFVACPNKCNGQGACWNGSTSICQCFPGFHGIDCLQRLCPSSKAWVDFPSASNRAHSDYTECSNMGKCNRQTGKCSCRSGFTGPACDIMLCPIGTSANGLIQPCSGRGKCFSLREVANYQDFVHFFNRTSYSDWDADYIHGCACDAGWEGVACQKRTCPKGDDPHTIDQVDATQLIDCKCTTCGGTMRITYEGKTTFALPYDASEELIEYSLAQLSTTESIRVSILQGSTLCSVGGSVTQITILLPHGYHPPLTLSYSSESLNGTIGVRANGDVSSIDSTLKSVKGTKENAECSNRGTCDSSTGTCNCFKGYSSSDGFGHAGKRGDCGFQYLSEITYYFSNSTNVTSTCPFLRNSNDTSNSTSLYLCAGHGTCNHTNGVCTCFAGFGGPGCQYSTCASPQAWFGDVLQSHEGHAVCAGVGECDVQTGKCFNCGGGWGVFYGDYCQHLSCQGGANGACSGNGQCLSLREMALVTYNDQKELAGFTYTDPWDADMVHGCSCYRAYSIDNMYFGHMYPLTHPLRTQITESSYFYSRERFYRGPYAFAASDWTGYDCSSASCPKGDDPFIRTGQNEIQRIVCRANNGSFQLSFRGNVSEHIAYNSTALMLEEYLEQLYTIHSVRVSVNGTRSNRTICDAAEKTVVDVEFLWEFGDLPLLVAVTDQLQDKAEQRYRNSYLMNITEIQKGTKADIECSGAGLCLESTGRCSCAEGFVSSNGVLTQAGERGDCGYYNPFYTVGYDGSKVWDGPFDKF